MIHPKDIEDLELEREYLHVFVIGPGYGEAIVVALPSAGWLVIDGAGRSVDRDYPVHRLLEHHLGNDVIEAMLLTHPHRDHYCGMRELIDHDTLGPKLRRLGCVARLVESEDDSSASQVLHAASERELLERIKSWWAANPRGKLTLCTGPLALDNLEVSARVLAPDPSTIDEFWRSTPGPHELLRQRVNELSVVLELRYGTGRFIFTGDLPEPHWQPLVEREGVLHEHDLLKLPHHGSEGAQPDGLLRRVDVDAPSRDRTWVLTPFNRGSAVSRPPTRRGLSALLAFHEPLHMTSFPTAWAQTTPAPLEVALESLSDAPVRLAAAPRGTITRRGVQPELRMRDCYWMFCFDQSGRLVRSERGRAATRVRTSVSTP